MAWCGMVWYTVWYYMVHVVWYMVWNGMVWYGMVYGVVLHGTCGVVYGVAYLSLIHI